MANILNILDKDTGKYVSVPAIQGASAYEVALKNGFEGSEEEWLASLKGEGADVDMSNYATMEYVDNALEEVTVDIDNVNLEGYATEEWTKDYINDNLETIATGYYESTTLKGEDVTDDVIAVNGELPVLRTYQGGTKYIFSGGAINLLINPKNEADTLYINDYVSMDVNQNFEILDTFNGNVEDYFIYGAYNKDLITKDNMLEYHQRSINKWANQNRTDEYYSSSEYVDTSHYVEYCGWSFYGDKDMKGDEWTSIHFNTGSVSQNVQDYLDKLEQDSGGATSFNHTTSDGSPGKNYRRYPCAVIDLQPYTTYTINYTGDTEGDQNYLKGLHYCLTNGTNGGACNHQPMTHERHLIGTYTDTFTTGNEMLKLILFVGRIKNTTSEYGNLTSDSAANISIDVVNYNINHLSVVQGNQTYEYYVDMIRDIDFDLSVIAMSMANESEYESYRITVPYNMKGNQYIRFNREKEIYALSRPLIHAVGMRIDDIEDSYMNYKVNEIGVIGRWIDNKDIYRTVLKVTLPEGTGSTTTTVNTSITLPDTIDTVTDLKVTRLSASIAGSTYRTFFGCHNESSYPFQVGATTYLPTASNPAQFYSTIGLQYANFWKNSEVAIVVEYTKYEMQEDGTII